MINQIREMARRRLPSSIRKPLGAFCGTMWHEVAYPLMGLAFDLGGSRMRLDGCEFQIPRDATTMGFRASCLLKDYEVDERRLVPKYVRPDDSVLELGGCLGVLSCITNRLLKAPRKHVVVEANPFCLPSIYKNRALNGCDFLVESRAVTKATEATFYLHPRFVTGSSVQNREGMAVRVPGVTLAELMERHGPFSVLIMDIEGGELETLEQSQAALEGVRLVIVELHEAAIQKQGVQRCREILGGCGFEQVERSYITEVWARAGEERGRAAKNGTEYRHQ